MRLGADPRPLGFSPLARFGRAGRVAMVRSVDCPTGTGKTALVPAMNTTSLPRKPRIPALRVSGTRTGTWLMRSRCVDVDKRNQCSGQNLRSKGSSTHMWLLLGRGSDIGCTTAAVHHDPARRTFGWVRNARWWINLPTSVDVWSIARHNCAGRLAERAGPDLSP